VTPSFEPLESLLRFAGKTVVVTGGGSGIGAALVRRFLDAGARVISVDQRFQSTSPNSDLLWQVEADVVADGALAGVIETVASRHGAVDVYINNAGAAPRSSILEMTVSQWDAALDLNLRAAFLGAQAAAAHMVARKSGVILNMLSSCVTHVGGNPAHYRAAKAGLGALTQSLAVELGRHGIRVLGIAPTLTETEQVQRLRSQGLGNALDKFVTTLPLGRPCSPDEVARVCVFAASPLASFMTGSVLFVDGGENAK
jgi:NAD(P)-dependent dehydrogenase (short-subunit alcohol dehydrogenase family)